MTFARWVFWLAGVYGVIAVTPQFFMEEQIGRDYPPAVTHPEYLYGFAGVALAWQVAFLVIGADPARLRPIMLPSILEKASFGVAAWVLFAQGRAPGLIAAFGTIDLVLGLLFAAAWWITGKSNRLRAEV
jgi:hypothetical protein